jgi:membrane peptidoglycan carboxypeptidase
MYLDSVYLGQRHRAVDAASRACFGTARPTG